MALRNLGKKHTHRALRDQYRLCPACGLRKPPLEFLSKPRSRVLDLLCVLCRAENPGISQSFFHIEQPKPSLLEEHRTAIIELLRERARRWIAKGKEVKGMGAERGRTPEEYAAKYIKTLDRIAAIVGKTYAEMGDAAVIADDEGHMMIRDELNELDDTLIERNKRKKLKRS
jgi:hypothetical protein